MTYINPKHIIVEFLRTNLLDPRARAESLQTELFDGGSTDFSLTATIGNVQAIKEVKVDSVVQVKWKDYWYDAQNQKIIFFSNTASGTNNVSVEYKYGTTNWIYPDKPKNSLSSTSFPRINVTEVSGTGERLGQYNSDIETAQSFQIDVWTKEDQLFTISSRKYDADSLADYIAYQITKAFEENIDELHPAFYNYSLLSTPRDMPFEEDIQCFRKMLEVQLKGINVGETYN
jgi:hypothetical protein